MKLKKVSYLVLYIYTFLERSIHSSDSPQISHVLCFSGILVTYGVGPQILVICPICD